MAKDFMLYWIPETAEAELDGSKLLAYAGSEQFKRVHEDDTLWIVTSFDGNLTLLGRLKVDRIVPRSEAVEILQTDDVWEASLIALARPDAAEPILEVDISDLAATLRFVSDRSDRLRVTDGRVNPNQLQTMRELTTASARLLYTRLFEDERPDGSVPTNDLDRPFATSEHARRVEAAAVAAVTTSYVSAGWKVSSVERDRIGYDLLCTRKKISEHVEVKGTAGTELRFVLTAGEFNRARADNRFVLVLVTDAIRDPQVVRIERVDLAERFNVVPIAYRVSEQSAGRERSRTESNGV